MKVITMRSRFIVPVLALFLVAAAPEMPAQFARPYAESGSRIGVGLRDLDADRAATLKLTSVSGVEVMVVETGSPAEQAGIKAGDVLLSYNGEPIVGAQQLGRLVSETPIGRKVKIEYSRDGKVNTIFATTAARQANHAVTFGNSGNDPLVLMGPVPMPYFSWTNPLLGIECEGLDARNAQLADFFGVKRGILVRSVSKDSAAAKAGLRAGDVITQFDGHTIADPKEISFLFRHDQRTAKTLALEVVREHKASTLKINLSLESQE